MRRKRVVGRLIAAGLAVGLLMYGGPVLPASAAGGPNLALGKSASASGHNDVYVHTNINDGNQATYWEGVNNSFPQWAQVDLGATTAIDQVKLKIPNGWGARSETLSVQGSVDGGSFTTIVGSAGYTFNAAGANTVTINFPASNTRFVRVNVTANSGWTAAQISELEIYGVTGTSANLAQGKTMSASGFSQNYTPSNANDGNQASYWESANNAFPQWLQVDLGATVSVSRVVLKLPAGWETRNQTLTVQSSTNGSAFSNITASTAYAFNPANSNVVTINFNATSTRYVRVNVTANSVWPAAQFSELEVYGPTTGDTQAPTTPGNLAYTQPASGQIRLTWNASTDNVGVTGYDIYANNTLRTSVAGNVLTYTDNQPITATVSYYVRAKDAAGNQSPNSNTVTRTGTIVDPSPPTAPTNLAYTQPAAGQIRLTWNASTDSVGVVGYDIYANNTLRASVAGNVLTYTDNQPATATVSYFVRARDAAGNLSGNSNTVTRTGTSVDTQPPTAPGNLAFTQPASGQIRLTWSASTDNVGVTGYDIYANNTVRASVAGGVLTYTDNQPDSATVSYYVRAKDAAGNVSSNSNTVTRTGTGTPGSNLAVGKPITASGSIFTFVPTNANDNSVTTYWEANAGGYPNTLTVSLGANASVSSIVLKLDPSPAWATRTQRIEVLGRDQALANFTSIAPATDYVFNPATGNTVTIPVTATAADVRLSILSNTGSSGGQVAEFQIVGTPAPNPDLTVTGSSWSPANPVETDSITATATVRNNGTAGSGATNVRFYLGTTLAGTAAVGTLAAGASVNVSASLGTRDAGSYQLTAKVDEANTVVELNDANNSFVNPSNLVVAQVPSSDLVAASSSWSPSNPAAGNTVTFSVAIRNQGTVASAGGAHGITVTVTNTTTGAVVRTLTGSFSGVIAPGATTSPVNLGTWTAVNGKYSVRVVLAVDANELPVKQANNTTNTPFFVGRGANMPYDMYEAEDGVVGGGASIVGPNRTVGDLAGEASGRKAVRLNSNGSYVEFTTKASTNTLVTRFSIPDSAGGTGTSATLNIYVNNTFLKAIDLNSKYAWLYGNETGPGNSPGAGGPRHIYDEANVLLGTTVPAGSKIKLQKDAANTSQYAIDFINLEQVSPIANPDPARYTVPAGFTQQDVQNALDRARQDANLLGVYLPPGDYQTAQKFQVYQKAIKVLGAGPWYTRFFAPSTQENTDVGIRADGTANGSTFSGFAYFGNYTSRIDGPGKVFDFSNVANMLIDNIWVEHMICMYWGANTDFVTIKNSRIRDTFADGINMTNGSTDNLVSNIEARSTGDDSFALFSAIDAGGADEKNNIYENLTSLTTWRAAGIAVYGGYANTFRNIYIADTLVYSGITISSLDFGYPMNGFGASPPTVLQNISIVRAGGHFWGAQTFPAIWVFSASKVFQGIRVSDVDIVDPTYHGIMFQTNYVGGTAQFPVTDTIFTNISITGAQKSGDAFDAKSGFGLWANESAEAGQGPAVGSVTFNNLTMSNNFQNVKNTTSTFTITINP